MRTSAAEPLREGSLEALARRGIETPGYDRRAPGPRIVHVGVGGFHRAHQAVYLDECAKQGSPWRITGVGPRSEDVAMVEALAPQQGLYTVIARGPAEVEVRVIGSLIDHVLAGPGAATLADRVAEPSTAIVSLTITEAGYGASAIEAPDGVFGGLVRGIERRRAARLPPVTVLSCDNILHNGSVAREAVLRAARRWAPRAEAYLERECTFPSSMVDRITPATTDLDRAWLRTEHGIDDRWPVVCERFRQWVIEDRFAAGRPRLEDVGVVLSDDVAAWETYKLRMLNASHTVIASVAALAGIDLVDAAMATAPIRAMLLRFLTAEVLPTVTPIPGHPAEAYAESVVERFSSTGIRDRVGRIAADGSVKWATFVMPTVEHRVRAGGAAPAAAAALAAWARYLAVVPASSQAPDVAGREARALATEALADPLRFLELDGVIPSVVARDEGFRSSYVEAARTIAEQGPLAAAGAAAG